MRMASRIWLPTVKTGLRLVIGSWNIMAMSLPLISCIRLSEVSSRFWSSKRISPSGYSAGGLGLSCMMERAVTLLPLPDSPTIPIVSPASSENDTPSTALTTPSWVLKCVSQAVAQEVNAQSRYNYQEPGEQCKPPLFGHGRPGILKQVTPRRGGRLDPQAKIRNGALYQDSQGDDERGLDRHNANHVR